MEPKFKKGDKALCGGIKVTVIGVNLSRPPRIYYVDDGSERGYCEEADLAPIENREDRSL